MGGLKLCQRVLDLGDRVDLHVERRGNAVAGHEGLGEALARLQLRGGLGGTEDGDAAAAELIDRAEQERHLGADDDQIRADLDGRFED